MYSLAAAELEGRIRKVVLSEDHLMKSGALLFFATYDTYPAHNLGLMRRTTGAVPLTPFLSVCLTSMWMEKAFN